MYKKIKSLKVNFALIVFIAFAIKMLLIEPSYADSIITAVFAGLYGYTQYLKRFQPYNLDEHIKADLVEVKTALSKLRMADSHRKVKEGKYF